MLEIKGDNYMNDTLKNIITSLGTSLIVSSVTFTLGLNQGKINLIAKSLEINIGT